MSNPEAGWRSKEDVSKTPKFDIEGVDDVEFPMFKFVALLLLLLCFVFSGWSLKVAYDAENRTKRQRHAHLMLQKKLEDKIEELEKKHISLMIEFNNFRTNTSYEFIRTWQSFNAVRNNFLSLGLGFHLEDKDITPEKELE